MFGEMQRDSQQHQGYGPSRASLHHLPPLLRGNLHGALRANSTAHVAVSDQPPSAGTHTLRPSRLADRYRRTRRGHQNANKLYQLLEGLKLPFARGVYQFSGSNTRNSSNVTNHLRLLLRRSGSQVAVTTAQPTQRKARQESILLSTPRNAFPDSSADHTPGLAYSRLRRRVLPLWCCATTSTRDTEAAQV